MNFKKLCAIILLTTSLTPGITSFANSKNINEKSIKSVDAISALESLLLDNLPKDTFTLDNNDFDEYYFIEGDKFIEEYNNIKSSLEENKIFITIDENGYISYAYPAYKEHEAKELIEQALSYSNIIKDSTDKLNINERCNQGCKNATALTRIGTMVRPNIELSATLHYYFHPHLDTLTYLQPSNISTRIYGVYNGTASYRQRSYKTRLYNNSRNLTIEVTGELSETRSPVGLPINIVQDWVMGFECKSL